MLIICYSRAPRLTNRPHMASCIETCFLDHPDVYIFPECSCRQRKGAAEHAALRVSKFSKFHRDPNSPSSFKLAPSPSSVGVKRADLAVRCWTGPQRRIGVGVSLLGSADWSHSRLRSGGRWGCFFPVRCSEPDTSFSGSLGGSKNGGGDERQVEEAEDEELPLSQCHYMNLIQG